jgi:hypothetical protein
MLGSDKMTYWYDYITGLNKTRTMIMNDRNPTNRKARRGIPALLKRARALISEQCLSGAEFSRATGISDPVSNRLINDQLSTVAKKTERKLREWIDKQDAPEPHRLIADDGEQGKVPQLTLDFHSDSADKAEICARLVRERDDALNTVIEQAEQIRKLQAQLGGIEHELAATQDSFRFENGGMQELGKVLEKVTRQRDKLLDML